MSSVEEYFEQLGAAAMSDAYSTVSLDELPQDDASSAYQVASVLYSAVGLIDDESAPVEATPVEPTRSDGAKVARLAKLVDESEELNAWLSSSSSPLSLGQAPSEATTFHASVRNWNDEYQRILEMPDSSVKFHLLRNVASDFVHASETYGRIIIAEHQRHPSLQTFKPAQVGGLAGGLKYVIQGILFKFSIDSGGLYGSDEAAMKSASHELRGLMQIQSLQLPRLCFPLMAYIDYRGFRLTAVSLLPLSAASLVYGSADAGQTVHTDDALVNELMRDMGARLNIKAHTVRDCRGDGRQIVGPADIEVHKGSDGRYYMLDFSRLAPPAPPTVSGSHLYNLLRMELVRAWPQPLCSDAYSHFGRDGLREHNAEVRAAWSALLNDVLPRFAQELDSSDADSNDEALLEEMHRRGINFRLLGRLRAAVRSAGVRQRLLIEAVSRTAASHLSALLRKELQATGMASEQPALRVALNFFNVLIGRRGAASQHYRRCFLAAGIERKFPGCLAADELLDTDDSGWLPPQHLHRVVVAVARRVGVALSSAVLEQLASAPQHVEFVFPDLLGLQVRVCHLNIVDYADGMTCLYEALERDSGEAARDLPTQTRLLLLAQTKLQSSSSAISNSFRAMIDLGNVMRLLALKQPRGSDQSARFFDSARHTLERVRHNAAAGSDVALAASYHLARLALSEFKYTQPVWRSDADATPLHHDADAKLSAVVATAEAHVDCANQQRRAQQQHCADAMTLLLRCYLTCSVLCLRHRRRYVDWPPAAAVDALAKTDALIEQLHATAAQSGSRHPAAQAKLDYLTGLHCFFCWKLRPGNPHGLLAKAGATLEQALTGSDSAQRNFKCLFSFDAELDHLALADLAELAEYSPFIAAWLSDSHAVKSVHICDSDTDSQPSSSSSSSSSSAKKAWRRWLSIGQHSVNKLTIERSEQATMASAAPLIVGCPIKRLSLIDVPVAALSTAELDGGFLAQLNQLQVLVVRRPSSALAGLFGQQQLEQLTALELSSCPLSDDEALSAVRACRNLVELNLSDTAVGDDTLAKLPGYTPRLISLCLQSLAGVTLPAVLALLAALPELAYADLLHSCGELTAADHRSLLFAAELPSGLLLLRCPSGFVSCYQSAASCRSMPGTSRLQIVEPAVRFVYDVELATQQPCSLNLGVDPRPPAGCSWPPSMAGSHRLLTSERRATGTFLGLVWRSSVLPSMDSSITVAAAPPGPHRPFHTSRHQVKFLGESLATSLMLAGGNFTVEVASASGADRVTLKTVAAHHYMLTVVGRPNLSVYTGVAAFCLPLLRSL